MLRYNIVFDINVPLDERNASKESAGAAIKRVADLVDAGEARVSHSSMMLATLAHKLTEFGAGSAEILAEVEKIDRLRVASNGDLITDDEVADYRQDFVELAPTKYFVRKKHADGTMKADVDDEDIDVAGAVFASRHFTEEGVITVLITSDRDFRAAICECNTTDLVAMAPERFLSVFAQRRAA